MPALEITVLLGVETVEVPPAAAVDERPALCHFLVIIPPECESAAVSLVQGQAAWVSWEGKKSEQSCWLSSLGLREKKRSMLKNLL